MTVSSQGGEPRFKLSGVSVCLCVQQARHWKITVLGSEPHLQRRSCVSALLPLFLLLGLNSTAVSIFVVILVELTNTVFVNSTNITTNIETAVLSTQHPKKWSSSPSFWRKKQPPCEAWQALFTVAAHGMVPVERAKYICKVWNVCRSLSLHIIWIVLMKESSWAGMCWATKLMPVSRTLWLRR